MYDSVQVHRLPSEHDVPDEFAPSAMGKASGGRIGATLITV
jgi:hypothetical protein